MKRWLLTAMMMNCFIMSLSLEAFSQEEWVYENHVLSSRPKPVDILFVIDNSPNLLKTQTQLAQTSSVFLESLNSLSWQVGITNSDVSSGPHGLQGQLVKFTDEGLQVLAPSTPESVELLKTHLVRRKAANCDPECPSDMEQPLKALTLSISGHLETSFFRKEAELAVIFLTDEDEMSTGPYGATKPGHVTNAMEADFPNKTLLPYSFIVSDKDEDCRTQQGEQSQFGRHIQYLVELHEGLNFSLCDPSYREPMISIANHIKEHLFSIQLEFEPEVSSIKIEAPTHLNQAPLKWTVEGKKIFFTSPLEEKNHSLTVKYKKSKWVVKPK